MATPICLITCFIAVMPIFKGVTADTHTVGDSLGWRTPVGAYAYSAWSKTQEFEAGDILVFNWNGTHDVAEVSKDDYEHCKKGNPIGSVQESSPANITIDSNGTRYFICTVDSHCELGQKVTITTGSNSASSLTIGVSLAVLSTMAVSFLNYI